MLETSPIEDAVNRLSGAMFEPLGAQTASTSPAAVNFAGNGGGQTNIYNIDVRGASMSEAQILELFKTALRDVGRQADARIRV